MKLDNPVVNYTHQIRITKSLRSETAVQKIICFTTPVICAIIVWTVSSVELLNNVVVGTGN